LSKKIADKSTKLFNKKRLRESSDEPESSEVKRTKKSSTPTTDYVIDKQETEMFDFTQSEE